MDSSASEEKRVKMRYVKRWVMACVALGALVVVVGCNSAPAPAPTVDTKAAEEAVRKTDADWVTAAKTGKAEEWIAFYTDDAVVLPPNEKTVVGKDAIRKPIADMMALPELAISWAPTKVEVANSGELAYLHGTYQMSYKGPDGKAVEDNGKMVEIWKKQTDGKWKCIVDMWSSDLPATTATK